MCKNLKQLRLGKCTCTYKCKCTSTSTSSNVLVSNLYKLCFCGHFISFCKLLAVELYTVFRKCQVHGLYWLLKLLQIIIIKVKVKEKYKGISHELECKRNCECYVWLPIVDICWNQ